MCYCGQCRDCLSSMGFFDQPLSCLHCGKALDDDKEIPFCESNPGPAVQYAAGKNRNTNLFLYSISFAKIPAGSIQWRHPIQALDFPESEIGWPRRQFSSPAKCNGPGAFYCCQYHPPPEGLVGGINGWLLYSAAEPVGRGFFEKKREREHYFLFKGTLWSREKVNGRSLL